MMLDVKCQLMRQYAPGLFYPSLIYYHHRLQLRRQSLSLSLSLSLIRVYWKSPATNYAGRGPVLLGPFFKVRILGF